MNTSINTMYTFHFQPFKWPTIYFLTVIYDSTTNSSKW